MKTFIRPKKSKFNFFNNLDKTFVNYGEDFKDIYAVGPQGLTWNSFGGYIFARVKQLVITIFDLILLGITVFVISKKFYEMSYEIF